MQGWHYGKGLIYLVANISANKISLLQGQSYTEGKYYNGSKNLNFKNTQMIHKSALCRSASLAFSFVLLHFE